MRVSDKGGWTAMDATGTGKQLRSGRTGAQMCSMQLPRRLRGILGCSFRMLVSRTAVEYRLCGAPRAPFHPVDILRGRGGHRGHTAACEDVQMVVMHQLSRDAALLSTLDIHQRSGECRPLEHSQSSEQLGLHRRDRMRYAHHVTTVISRRLSKDL